MPNDPTTLAVLAGTLAIYGAIAVGLTHLLRRFFPIEGTRSRLVVWGISISLACIAAVQVGLTTIPALPPDQRVAGVMGLAFAIWWASQEIYRRMRGDLWRTRRTHAWSDQ